MINIQPIPSWEASFTDGAGTSICAKELLHNRAQRSCTKCSGSISQIGEASYQVT